MIYVKDHKQRDMFNPFAHLGTKPLAVLESSWAHLFREEILHNLPAEKLFQFYNDSASRAARQLTSTRASATIVTVSQNAKSNEITGAVPSATMPSHFVFPGAESGRKKLPSQKNIAIVPASKEPCQTLIV